MAEVRFLPNVAALYRLSTKKQVARKYEDEVDIPSQKKAVEDFLRSRPDWKLVAQYEEKGVSAFKISAADRDVLQDAFRDASAGRWSILVIFKADRLSRRSLEYPGVLATFHGMNVEVWSVADQAGGKLLSIDNQMDKLVRFVEGWQAETESVNTRIRTTTRKTQLAQEGRWNGTRVPFGYYAKPQLGPDGQPLVRGGRIVNMLVPNENAAIVRSIFHDYIQGQSSITLATRLNNLGVPSPSGKPWRSDTIVYMLQNPFYYGMVPYRYSRRFRREGAEPIVVQGTHEPIIDKNLFDRAAAVRQAKATIPLKQRAAVHPLAGILFCGECGGRMGGHVKRRQSKRKGEIADRRYRCLNSQLRGTCSMPSLRAEKVEDAFQEALERELGNPSRLSDFLRQREQERHALIRDAMVVRKRAEERLAVVEGALRRLDRAYLEAGTMGDDEYVQRKSEYQAERIQLENELAAPLPAAKEKDYSVLAQAARDIRANWPYMSEEGRKTFALSISEAYELKAILHRGPRVDLQTRE